MSYTCTDLTKVHSQGLLVSKDNTCALYHGSTTPPNFYRAKGWITGNDSDINMDRGGFGRRKDGTNCGSIFDGVTAGGRLNLYAAQAFADYVTPWLARNGHKFQQGADVNDGLSRTLFKDAVERQNNPGNIKQEYNAEGGAATGLFCTIQLRKGKEYCVVNGAGIGDATAIQLICAPNQYEARVLSVGGIRNHGNAADNGGQLTMSIGVNGEVWTFSHPIGLQDFVLLCTDGVTDNIFYPEISTIIPLIVSLPAFDHDLKSLCPTVVGPNAHLPTYYELSRLFDLKTRQSMSTIKCEQIVVRLFHYTKWVTARKFELEQEYYSTEMKRNVLAKMLHGQKPGAGTDTEKERITKAMQGLDKDQLMMRNKKRDEVVGKTDDTLLVAFKPTCKK
eukprot:m.78762 g.78762  ORF g.78762 m.78762 type:complete len:391 (+) comp12688_c0_seq2:387-1559(+)